MMGITGKIALSALELTLKPIAGAFQGRTRVKFYSARGNTGRSEWERYIQVVLENRGKNPVKVGPLFITAKRYGFPYVPVEMHYYNYFPRENNGIKKEVDQFNALKAVVPYDELIKAAGGLGVPLDELRFIVQINGSSRSCGLPKGEAEIIKHHNIYGFDL